MEQRVEFGDEFLPLTSRQVVNNMRQKLEHITDEDTLEKKQTLWIRLIHPEVLTWQRDKKSTLPPQEGRFVQFLYGWDSRRQMIKTMPDAWA